MIEIDSCGFFVFKIFVDSLHQVLFLDLSSKYTGLYVIMMSRQQNVLT